MVNDNFLCQNYSTLRQESCHTWEIGTRSRHKVMHLRVVFRKVLQFLLLQLRQSLVITTQFTENDNAVQFRDLAEYGLAAELIYVFYGD